MTCPSRNSSRRPCCKSVRFLVFNYQFTLCVPLLETPPTPPSLHPTDPPDDPRSPLYYQLSCPLPFFQLLPNLAENLPLTPFPFTHSPMGTGGGIRLEVLGDLAGCTDARVSYDFRADGPTHLPQCSNLISGGCIFLRDTPPFYQSGSAGLLQCNG